MKRPWTPEVDVSEELAATLIRAQFPDVAAEDLRELGSGWDNVAYLVDERFVFRFPRREFAVPFLRSELLWLPRLAPSLPVPVSAACFAGVPTDAFPWPFGGYELVPGETLCSRELDASARLGLAQDLAWFLRALHSIPVPDPSDDVPLDSIHRMDLERRLPLVRERSEEVAARTPQVDWARVLEVLAELSTTPAEGTAPTWTHGDLYARHLLVDAAGRLSGVIDWGDLHVGEVAVDLSAAYSLFDRTGRRSFFDAYGPVGEAARRRARGRALFHSSALVHYGVTGPEPALLRVGLAGVTNALAGD